MSFTDGAFVVYRMMPFILVSFFLLSSIFGGDLYGFYVFLGLLVTSLVPWFMGQSEFIKNQIFNGMNDSDIIAKLKTCNLISISESPISFLPLSTHTFTFLFGYFFWVITKTNGAWANNWGFFLFLSLLAIFDMYYNSKNCYGYWTYLVGAIGVILGIIWAVIFGKSNWLVPQKSKQGGCSLNKKNEYSCQLTTSGRLLT